MKRLNERMKAWHDQDAFWETVEPSPLRPDGYEARGRGA